MVLAWRCQRWKTLPKSGGLFDQPLAVMIQMEVVQYIAETFQERAAAAEAKKLIEWSTANPDKLNYCRRIEAEMGT